MPKIATSALNPPKPARRPANKKSGMMSTPTMLAISW